ncbi:MAG: class I SAM-dependent methyltransferase [Methanobrevibacter sp.]|nr:class I SAM-dependent methyltransferase [Methanobrevibacter sp.]
MKDISLQDNTENVLMSIDEIWFLKKLLEDANPKKIVEIGISAGGTTVNLLKWKDKSTELFSIDVATQWHRDPTKLSGFMADEVDVKDNFKLYRGYDYLDVCEEIGGDIDFIIIDTTHVLPGEILTFIAALPYLKDGCVVVLHDIHLNMRYFGTNKFDPYNIGAYCTGILHGGVCSSEKYVLKSDMMSNIGAFVVDKSTRDNIKDVFHLLCTTWYSFPDELNWEGYSNFVAENYSEDCKNLFNSCLEYQSIYFNYLEDINSKIEKLNEDNVSEDDCIKYDKGIISYFSDIWSLSNVQLIRRNDYTVLTKENKDYSFKAFTHIPDICTIEFEVFQVDGIPSAFFAYFGNEKNELFGGFSINHCKGTLKRWVNVRIDVSPSKYVITNKNTGESTTRTFDNNEVSKFFFRTTRDITTIYFRNFKVY